MNTFRVKPLPLKNLIGLTHSIKKSFKSFEKALKNLEGWVFIFILKKSLKVIKSLIFTKVNNFFNTSIFLESL